MAIVWTPTYADGQDIAFGSATYTAVGKPLGTGTFVVFTTVGFATTSACTIDGNAATLVTSTGKTSMWYANTSNATGNIVTTNSSVHANVVSWGGLITGNSTSAPAGSTVKASDSHADPQAVGPLTVPTGSLGLVGIGAPQIGIPTTWNNAIGDAILDASVATGNTSACSGAHLTGTGAGVTPDASGAWGFSGCEMIFAYWNAVAAAVQAGPINVPTFSYGVLRR